MKKLISSILVAAMLVTAAITAVPAGAEVTLGADSAAIGFEDGTQGVVTASAASVEVIDGGADGSAKALKVTNTANNGEVEIPLTLNLGTTYTVTAKVKGETLPDGNNKQLLVNMFQYLSDGTSFGWTTNVLSDITTGWQTFTTTFTPTSDVYIGGGNYASDGTGKVRFSIRFGNGNGSNISSGNVCLIDDIVIRPVYTEANNIFDSFNLDFNDQTTGVGTYAAGNSAQYPEYETGNRAIRAIFWGGHEIIKVANLRLRPNSNYRISYKFRTDFDTTANAKLWFMPVINRTHADSNGAAPSKESNSVNGETWLLSKAQQITKDWTEVSFIYQTSLISAYDDLGTVTMNFRVSTTNTSAHQVTSGTAHRVDIDDFKVEPLNVPNGAYFSEGQLPKTSDNSAVTYNSGANQLDVAINSASSNEIHFGLPLDNDAKYKITFDAKGDNGLKLLPILFADLKGFKWINGSDITISDAWKTYSAVFDYNATDRGATAQVYPLLWIRTTSLPNGETGSYSLKNMKVEKLPKAGISSITAPESLVKGQDASISFTDIASSSAGYVYTVYSKNANGDKTVYANGTSAEKTATFTVNAPKGTALYADAAAVSAEGVTSGYTEAALGTVTELPTECVVTAEILDGETNLTGQITIQNNATEKKIYAYLAQYAGDNSLLSLSVKNYTVASYGEETFNDLTAALDDKTAYAKLMVWNEHNNSYCTADVMN